MLVPNHSCPITIFCELIAVIECKPTLHMHQSQQQQKRVLFIASPLFVTNRIHLLNNIITGNVQGL